MIFNEQYSHFWNYESPQNPRDQVTREHALFLKNVGAGWLPRNTVITRKNDNQFFP
jgi:hypothetical protein